MSYQRAHAWLGLVLMTVATAGCTWHRYEPPYVDRYERIPAGAIPQPPGTHTCLWQDSHAAKADCDRLVIYRREWLGHTAELSPGGKIHLQRLVEEFGGPPGPIVVERTDEAERDEARRQAVVECLATLGVASPEQCVVIATAEAEGLYGEEADMLATRIFRGRGTARGMGAGGRASTVSTQSSGGFRSGRVGRIGF